jgi:hypothetical protein
MEFKELINKIDKESFKRLQRNLQYSEIIKTFGSPMSHTEVYNVYNQILPGVLKTYDSVKSVLFSARLHYDGDRLFYYDHRVKKFGLSEWGKFENKYYYWSRREIVYDFLNNENEPIHIIEIYEYVNKFKQTASQNSLIENLKLQGSESREIKYDLDDINNDNNNDFYFFNNQKIGLKTKMLDYLNNLNINDKDDLASEIKAYFNI